MVKLINTKLQYVSHFHVSVTQQVNFFKDFNDSNFPLYVSMEFASHVNHYQKIYVKTGQWAL